MSDPHDHNHHSFAIDPVYHAIVAHANPKMLRLAFELLAARRKRILAERDNFFGDAPLMLPVEVTKFPGSGRREFKNIARGH